MEKTTSFFKDLKNHPWHIAALSGIALVLVGAIVLSVILINPFGSSSNPTSGNNWPDVAPSDEEAGLSFKTLSTAPSFQTDLSQFLLTTTQNPGLPFNVACHIKDDRITAVLPAGLDLSKIKVTFRYNGQEVKMGDTPVKSDETVFDFTKPVTLTLVPKEGAPKKVTVTVMTLGTGLPSMSITTTDLAEVSSKTEYADCSVYAGGGDKKICSYATDSSVTADAKIKGRGWTSWYYYTKKSYSLTFDTKQSLFGLPASDEWVLAANFADRSLMRNMVATQLAKDLGMETVMEVRPVDLWVNGAYAGNYQLIERIKISKDRVDITEFDPAKSPDQVGYIIETNGHNKPEGEFGKYTNGQDADRPSKWQPFGLATYDPISGDIFFNSLHYKSVFVINKPSDTKLNTLEKSKAEGFVSYIYDYIDKMEAAILSQDYAEASKYLDMDAMAKWYLVEETTMNVDSRLHCSCYMYKDAGGKMKMGPVWDFDLGLGNGQFVTDSGKTYLDDSTWFKDLLAMPEFKENVKTVWNKNRSKLNNMSKYISDQSTMLNRAATANFKLWDISEEAIWTNAKVLALPDFNAQVSFVDRFMVERFDYMDSKLGSW